VFFLGSDFSWFRVSTPFSVFPSMYSPGKEFGDYGISSLDQAGKSKFPVITIIISDSNCLVGHIPKNFLSPFLLVMLFNNLVFIQMFYEAKILFGILTAPHIPRL
jgi:hypothetical protein